MLGVLGVLGVLCFQRCTPVLPLGLSELTCNSPLSLFLDKVSTNHHLATRTVTGNRIDPSSTYVLLALRPFSHVRGRNARPRRGCCDSLPKALKRLDSKASKWSWPAANPPGRRVQPASSKTKRLGGGGIPFMS